MQQIIQDLTGYPHKISGNWLSGGEQTDMFSAAVGGFGPIVSIAAWEHAKNNFRNLKVAIKLRGMIAKTNWEVIFDASL
jgi:hypothetical protein